MSKKDEELLRIIEEQEREDARDPFMAASRARAGAAFVASWKQKIRRIECEYDPRCCSGCKKFLDKDLKTCSKCKFAKYCSRACQTADWKNKHKKHCNEVVELNERIQSIPPSNIEAEIFPKETRVIQRGKTWCFNKNVDYSEMVVHDEKVILIGQNMASEMFTLDMFNAITAEREISHALNPDRRVYGLCVAQLDGKVCIAASFWSVMPQGYIYFWVYPNLAQEPCYTYTDNYGEISKIGFAQGRLFVQNMNKIQEFDTSNKPIKPTGHEIATGQPIFPPAIDLRIAEGRELGNLRFFLNYRTDEGDLLRCFNYHGQLLWAIEPKPQPLGGQAFRCGVICTDKKGRLFEANPDTKTISLVMEDQSLQPIIKTVGRIDYMGCCDVTNQLYVINVKKDAEYELMVSRYDVLEI